MKTAKYKQVIHWIREQIASGSLKEGDRLQTEAELGRQFGLSRQTVRHALEVLEQEGILVRVQGSGSYVKERPQREKGRPQLSRTVTIVSSYVDGYIFPRLLKSMVEELSLAGYSSRVMFTSNQIEKEKGILEDILKEKEKGPLIMEPVTSGLPNPNQAYYQKLLENGIPILFFNSFYPELEIPHICMNDEEAGRIATKYLISLGHRSIGGIFKADDGQGRFRYKGYVKSLYEADIEIDEKRICWVDTQEQNQLLISSGRVLERLSGCTACVCYNDEVAHTLTKICAREGIRIPEQLSVVSIDNSDLAKLNAVPLTSVAHPMETMGKKTAQNLLKLIQDPGYDATYEFIPELKIRESVLPAGECLLAAE